MLLDGKAAIVTGIGPGLGQQLVRSLAEHGADVVMCARRPDTMEKLAAQVAEMGRRAIPVVADVTSPDDCARVAATAEGSLGGLDVLVNNAFHQGDFQTMLDADLDRWRRTMEVNFFGALHMVRACAPLLQRQDNSRIVMVNTMSTQRVQTNFGAYAASKGALATITKTLAKELGPSGIRVNGVHPGYIYADSVEQYFHWQAADRGVDFQTVYDEVASETALRYLPTPDEIAGAVVFFASPLASCITGQSLAVNAGHWM